MNLIRLAIERPIAVVAMTLMIVLFGVIALRAIPVQLAPDVDRPVINVSTFWPGAAPAEIEREIVNRQEEVLAGLEGLEELSSSSTDSSGNVRLEFAVGTDMDKALLLVANRLDRVSDYPDEALEPALQTAGADDNPIAWFILTRKPGNTKPIHTYGEFAEDVIAERFERVAGVGLVNVYGGTERELQVILDPYRMASFGLGIGETLAALHNRLGAAMRENEARGLDFLPPGGESPRMVQRRLRSFLADLAEQKGLHVAVCHKSVIRCVMALAYDWPMLDRPPVKLQWECLHRFRLGRDGQPHPDRMNIALLPRSTDG